MANVIYKNLSGSTATLLETRDLVSMHLANIHATDSATVDLYLSKVVTNTDRAYRDVTPLSSTTYTYYIVKGLVIPIGTTLILEEYELANSYRTNDRDGNHNLYIKLGASDSTVDMILYSGTGRGYSGRDNNYMGTENISKRYDSLSNYSGGQLQ